MCPWVVLLVGCPGFRVQTGRAVGLVCVGEQVSRSLPCGEQLLTTQPSLLHPAPLTFLLPLSLLCLPSPFLKTLLPKPLPSTQVSKVCDLTRL